MLIRKKKMQWPLLLSLLLFVPAFFGCSAYKGYVVDSETKEPIEGVVVFMEFLQPNPVEGRHVVDAAEAVTDQNGYFSVPSKGWSLFPIQMFPDNPVTVFKSGYEPLHAPFWSKLISTEELRSSRAMDRHVPYTWKVSYGKPYLLMYKYKNLEEMRKGRMENGVIHSLSPGGPPENRKFLDDEIKKERDLLYILQNESK